MFHDDKMDIFAYILIKLIGTACAWKEDIWQYNILFCILTVGKHGTDARIQEFSSWGEGPGRSDKKALTTIFFSPPLILQKSNGQFQRNLSFFKAPDGVQLLIPYRNPFNLWFSRGCLDPLPPSPSGSALGAALTASWLRLLYIISLGLGKR